MYGFGFNDNTSVAGAIPHKYPNKLFLLSDALRYVVEVVAVVEAHVLTAFDRAR